jgi:hypothetical protein
VRKGQGGREEARGGQEGYGRNKEGKNSRDERKTKTKKVKKGWEGS